MNMRTNLIKAFSVVLLLSGASTMPMARLGSMWNSGKAMFQSGKKSLADADSNVSMPSMPKITLPAMPSMPTMPTMPTISRETVSNAVANASQIAKDNADKLVQVARTVPVSYAVAGGTAAAALGAGTYVYANTPKAQPLPSFGKALGLDIEHTVKPAGKEIVVDENLANLEVPVASVSLRNQGPVSDVISENGVQVVSFEPVMPEYVAPAPALSQNNASELDECKRLQELDKQLAESQENLERQKKLLSVETDLVSLVRSDRELDAQAERLAQEDAAVQEELRVANEVADKPMRKANRKEVALVAQFIEPKADVALSSKAVRLEDEEIQPLPAPVADNAKKLKAQPSELTPIAAVVYKTVAIPVKKRVKPLVKPVAPVVTVTISSEPIASVPVAPVVEQPKAVAGVLLLRDTLLTRENNQEKILSMSKDILDNCAKDRTFDINAIVDENGNTLLHIATMQKYLSVAEYLLANGAKPSLNIKNREGKTPLMIAAKSAVIPLVKCYTSLYSAQCKRNN